MSTSTISPLRQRMIDDMTARQLGPQTQRLYIRCIYAAASGSTAFIGRSPETAIVEDKRIATPHLLQSQTFSAGRAAKTWLRIVGNQDALSRIG